MSNRVLHKRTEVAGRVPALTDLLLGELAINVTDGKIFLKKKPASGTETIVQLGEVSLTGDVTGTGAGEIAVTLANSGVAAGTYASVTVDAKGRVTAGTSTPAITGGTINGATIGATTASTGRFTSLATTGNTTVGGALTVTGNLVVNGTTTTVNSTSVSVDDPVFTLGGDVAPTLDDNKDRGIEFRWHNGSVARTGFFGFDDSTGKFTFIPDATNTSEVFAGTKGTLDAYLEFTDVLSKPTTLAGYGVGVIPDAHLSGTYTGVNISGNAGTATKLATARTINGVAFDGTANITVADATKLPLAGGTMTGAITLPTFATSWIGGTGGSSSIRFAAPATAASWHAWAAQRTAGGNAWALGVLGESFYLSFASQVNLDAGTNATTQVFTATATGLSVNGVLSGNGSGLTNLDATKLSGVVPDASLSGTYTGVSITGNAATATKLATARTISLTGDATGSVTFDGSANASIAVNVTTADSATTAAAATKLATARTINGVAFDGTANITVVDAGAVRATGDTITGKISVGDTLKRSAGMYGIYDSTKICHVWSMGTGYTIPDDGTTFGNLYGMAYKHTNNTTGGTMAGGHQIVFANNGTPGAAIGLAGGMWTSGLVTAATFNATSVSGGGFQGIDADTVAAPSFTWSADLDTGMYHPTADTIGFTTAGVDRVQINSSGLTCQTWLRTVGQSGWYSQTYGGGLYMVDTTWVRVYGGKAFYVANDIAATGNVTAYYSDERLKENIRPIENALDTLCTLQGVRYNANELAGTFGYDRSKQEVGLLAQQVQAVMPEAVEQAPFDRTGVAGESKTGEHYLTLKYERMVPLLVEAIKEQKSLIDELRAGMDELRAEIRALKG